jgi:hypothetical protein
MKTFLLLSVLGGSLGSAIAVLADQADGMPSWAQYGLLGLALVGLLYTKVIVAGWTYQELKVQLADTKQELKEVRIENKELTQQIIQGQQIALPALQTSGQVISDALPILKDAQTIIKEWTASAGDPKRGGQ